MKVLNAGAWSRSSERVPVSLPMELEDFIPGVEEFYRKKHNGRKLHWHHIMSNGVVSETFLLTVSYYIAVSLLVVVLCCILHTSLVLNFKRRRGNVV